MVSNEFGNTFYFETKAEAKDYVKENINGDYEIVEWWKLNQKKMRELKKFLI